MANIFTPILAVTGGKKDLKLTVRVAHIWFIRDKENSDEIIFMNMILVDEKRGWIHAAVRKYLVPTIQKMVEEGGTYKLENVMIG
ncbi:nucleic acid-binding, OB-fold-like protein, putative [Medicago truncatula]|uniref:Nucleic acid-binding, OB-fold-like protein, putative n=1 Tax=Medicago truncatula TaxID=3880 RepID=A0A072TYC4_MEDTR|nr:nucleic acid-binding, OB-fold-like protein, putative [Medicago truncatula]